MKIAIHGLDLPEGKSKYDDPIVQALAEKFDPPKVSPYYLELIPDGFEEATAIAVGAPALLDVLILDMERVENRIARSEDEQERELLQACLPHLEAEVPLCDADLSDEQEAAARTIGALSLKPLCVLEPDSVTVESLCEAVLRKAGKMFFYTAGKKEVKAWLVDHNAPAIDCAAEIHSDLARGFIKAEILPFDDMMKTHSMQSARSEGLTHLIDRDDPVPEQTVLEIRFNV